MKRIRAYGLRWRGRSGGIQAIWICPKSKVQRGFPIKTRLLWRGQEPSIADLEEIVLACRQFHREVRDWVKNPSQRRPDAHGGKAGQIYFARCGELIKIGFGVDARKRVRALQTSSAHPIELLGVRPGTPDREKVLHYLFSHLRESGEWFRVGNDLLEYISVNTCRTDMSNVFERAA